MLEHILSFLPFKDLLLAQAISQTFRGAITSSPRLRKKLHMTADPDAAFSTLPIVPRFFYVRDAGCFLFFGDINQSKCLEDFNMCNAGGLKSDSWQRLFVTQPPIKTLTCNLRSYVAEPGRAYFIPVETLHVEEGITLGSIARHITRCDLQAARSYHYGILRTIPIPTLQSFSE